MSLSLKDPSWREGRSLEDALERTCLDDITRVDSHGNLLWLNRVSAPVMTTTHANLIPTITQQRTHQIASSDSWQFRHLALRCLDLTVRGGIARHKELADSPNAPGQAGQRLTCDYMVTYS